MSGSQETSGIDKNSSNEEEIDWDDPDLINNPEKLIKLKFDEKDIQAASSSRFSESLAFFTEFNMETIDVEKILESMSLKSHVPYEEILDRIIAKAEAEQEKFLQMYTNCKNKPFWNCEKSLSQGHKENVEKWLGKLQRFTTTCDGILKLRFGHKSPLENDSEEENKLDKLVQDLIKINKELAKYEKVFENIE